jgi:uncharacterized membrane protein
MLGVVLGVSACEAGDIVAAFGASPPRQAAERQKVRRAPSRPDVIGMKETLVRRCIKSGARPDSAPAGCPMGGMGVHMDQGLHAGTALLDVADRASANSPLPSVLITHIWNRGNNSLSRWVKTSAFPSAEYSCTVRSSPIV